MQHEQLDLFRHLKAFLRPTRAAAGAPKANAELPAAVAQPVAVWQARGGQAEVAPGNARPASPPAAAARRADAQAQPAGGAVGAAVRPIRPGGAATQSARLRVADLESQGLPSPARGGAATPAPSAEARAQPRAGDVMGAAMQTSRPSEGAGDGPFAAPQLRGQRRGEAIDPAPQVPGGAALAGAPSPEAPRAVATREELLVKADRVARAVSTELGVPVRLRVTDNRSTMVSFKRQEKSLALRLHHMFLDAPPAVLKAVADYAGRGKGGAGKVLDGFIHEAQERIRAGRRKSAALVPSGRHFELQDIFDRMNEAYFQGGIRASIGWGRPTTKRRRRSIRLGVYDHHAREIRVHPSLDRPDVPLFFVEYIVFHEMLHQLFPSSRSGGRAVHHPRAFRDRERAYPQYGLAIAWEKQHLEQLLRR